MSSLLATFLEHARPRALDRVSFLVGGAVRDLLLGISLNDIDISLDGDPCMVAGEFAGTINASFVMLDEEYRICRVVKGDQYIDFSPLRGGSIEQDLSERDLTINAMALPLSGDHRFEAFISGWVGPAGRNQQEKGLGLMPADELSVIDPYGGRLDIARRVIRMVSEGNFVKDPLRLLRVYRFAATLGFAVEVQTASAVRRHGPLISSVAAERIMEEMRHIFCTGHSSGVIDSMDNDSLLGHIVPEMTSLSREQRFHNRQSYRYAEHILHNLTLYFPGYSGPASASLAVPFRKVAIKLALLLGELSLGLIAAERLRMSGRERDLLEKVIRNADALQKDLSVAEMVTLLREIGDGLHPMIVYGISRNLICQMADNPVLSRARRLIAFYHEEFMPRRAMLPVITGNDLMREFGLKPSPLVGMILESVERGFLEGAVTSRDEAMVVARKLISERR